jgi:hypothetical protein
MTHNFQPLLDVFSGWLPKRSNTTSHGLYRQQHAPEAA